MPDEQNPMESRYSTTIMQKKKKMPTTLGSEASSIRKKKIAKKRYTLTIPQEHLYRSTSRRKHTHLISVELRVGRGEQSVAGEDGVCARHEHHSLDTIPQQQGQGGQGKVVGSY